MSHRLTTSFVRVGALATAASLLAACIVQPVHQQPAPGTEPAPQPQPNPNPQPQPEPAPTPEPAPVSLAVELSKPDAVMGDTIQVFLRNQSTAAFTYQAPRQSSDCSKLPFEISLVHRTAHRYYVNTGIYSKRCKRVIVPARTFVIQPGATLLIGSIRTAGQFLHEPGVEARLPRVDALSEGIMAVEVWLRHRQEVTVARAQLVVHPRAVEPPPDESVTSVYEKTVYDARGKQVISRLTIYHGGRYSYTSRGKVADGFIPRGQFSNLLAMVNQTDVRAFTPTIVCKAMPSQYIEVSANGGIARWPNRCGATPSRSLVKLNQFIAKTTGIQ